jgi:hypothetical protein
MYYDITSFSFSQHHTDMSQAKVWQALCLNNHMTLCTTYTMMLKLSGFMSNTWQFWPAFFTSQELLLSATLLAFLTSNP